MVQGTLLTFQELWGLVALVVGNLMPVDLDKDINPLVMLGGEDQLEDQGPQEVAVIMMMEVMEVATTLVPPVI